ncbi:MAG: PDZ domain-containing protein [Chitinophagaceae bacterium]|nr:PDZ domain-containing protein [Chitinophagaceae bacterium]
MKKILLPVFALILGVLFSVPAKAQEKSNEEQQLTIRLKSGEVKTITPGQLSPLIVDGKAISPSDIQSITITGRPFGRMGSGIRSVQGFRISDYTFLGVYSTKNDKGAEVTEVSQGSPAEKAGLQKGDIITKVDNTAIDGPEALSKAIRALKPDQKVSISILRNGKKQNISATLGSNNSFTINTDSLSVHLDKLFRNRSRIPDTRIFDSLRKRFRTIPGYPVRPARPSLGLQIQETEDGNGVTVLKVTPDSHADKAGIKVGDLITAIDGKAIKSVDDVTDKISLKEGEEYKLDVMRDKKPMTVTIKIPKQLKKITL